MKLISLTNGGHVKVDDMDYEYLSQWNWQRTKLGYAGRCQSLGKYGKAKGILMHRQLLNLKKGQITDHVNRDRLDNRRENLRIVNWNENNRNKSKQHNNTSGYIGVTRSREVWKSFIYFNNKRHHIVATKSKIEAAYIRDQVALQLHGEFASTNFDYR